MNREVLHVRFDGGGVHLEEFIDLQELEESGDYDATEIYLKSCSNLCNPDDLVSKADFYNPLVADISVVLVASDVDRDIHSVEVDIKINFSKALVRLIKCSHSRYIFVMPHLLDLFR